MNGKHPRASVNFHFKSEARLRTAHGTVFAFLDNPDIEPGERRERILEALSAFWLPLAAKWKYNGGSSLEEVQQIAKDALYHLELRKRVLRQEFLEVNTFPGKTFQPPRDRLITFTFRSQPGRGTRDWLLLSYLQSDEPTSLPHRQRVLHALTAFWLPEAAYQQQTFSTEQIAAFAKDSIEHIDLHMQYLARSFGFELRQIERPVQIVSPLDGVSTPSYTEEEAYDDEDAIVSDWL